jgi:hypothetical protein
MDIQPADIVLVHSNGISLLRMLTGMYYNHVFIIDERIFDDWKICESIAKGTAPTLLSDYKGQELRAFRYKGITREQQDRVRYELSKMGHFKYDFYLPFRIIWKVKFGIFKLLFKLWSKDYPLNIPHDKDSWVVCSEYAQEAYSRAGLPILDDKYLMIPDSPLYEPMKKVVDTVWQTS